MPARCSIAQRALPAHPMRRTSDDITPQQVAEADAVERRVRQHAVEAELAWLRLAYVLRQARGRRLWRARGYESFRDWVESPEVDLDYRKARDLIRVVELLEPALGSSLIAALGARKARALLPLVQLDERGQVVNAAELLEVARDIRLLTWKDACIYVRELRGRPPRVDRRPRFLAECQPHGRLRRLVVRVAQESQLYAAGQLVLEPQHVEPLLEALRTRGRE